MAFSLKIGSLFVEIRTDTKGLEEGKKQVRKATTEMQAGFSRLGGVVAAVLSVEVARRVTMLADSMVLLDAKIKSVSRSAKEFEAVRQGIRDIAVETGASIDNVAQMTQRMLIAGDTLGATTEQIVAATEAFTKLGIIGGSTFEAMKFAQLQFGQAMSGTNVRAEEFNSLIENTPLVAKAIADGMGMTVGQLQRAVKNGEVLSKDVFNALISQTDKINQKFDRFPLTIQRASGQLVSSFAIALSEINEGTGATESLAEVIAGIAKFFETDFVPIVDELVGDLETMGDLYGDMLAPISGAVEETGLLQKAWQFVKDTVSTVFDVIINLPLILKQAAINVVSIGDRIRISLVGTISESFAKLSFTVTAFFKRIPLLAKGFALKAGAALANGIAAGLGKINIGGVFDGAIESTKAFVEETRTSADSYIEQAQRIADAAELQKNFVVESINAETEAKIKASLTAEKLLNKQLSDEIKAAKQRAKIRQKEREERRRLAKEGKKANDEIIQSEVKKSSVIDDQTQRNVNTTANAIGQIFGLQKEAAIVNATLSMYQAIAKAMEKGAIGFAEVASIISAFAGLFSAIRSLKAPGRAFGGPVSPGLATPINERGAPEMFVGNSGRQFLLPSEPGKVVPLKAGASGSAQINVEIVNNSNAVVSEPVVTEGRLMIEINNAIETAVDRVNASLSSGRGPSAEAARQGFALTRNI